MCPSASLRSTGLGSRCWRRENASSCDVSFAPRSAAIRIWERRCFNVESGGIAEPSFFDKLEIPKDDGEQIVEIVSDA